MAKGIASKQKPKKSPEAITKGEMEQLLADQASIILNAVGERLSAQEKRSNIRLEKMEARIIQTAWSARLMNNSIVRNCALRTDDKPNSNGAYLDCVNYERAFESCLFALTTARPGDKRGLSNPGRTTTFFLGSAEHEFQ